MKYFSLMIVLLVGNLSLTAADNELLSKLIGSAYLDNKSYDFLEKICDLAGGRSIGTPNNEKALGILKESLGEIGYTAKQEEISFPGWVRGDDEVEILEPTQRKLHVAALGYVDKTPEIISDIIYAGHGYNEDFDSINPRGKIAVVHQGGVPGRDDILRYQAIDNAAAHGAAAILFINDKLGDVLLCGVADFQGIPSKIPAYSITHEEGLWLMRLLNRNLQVKMKIITNSFCTETKTYNTIATLPGKSPAKIVIGAHFDGWDMGQAAIDNGSGTAVLFDLARLMKKFSPDNYYTVEFVWFNGEELGLWGSKRYIKMHSGDDIVAMVNMDMIGTPTGFNAMGFDDYVPALKNIAKKLNGFNIDTNVTSSPWTNSDHEYFMFRGIPTFTIDGKLDKEMYEYYHDAGDTFDKASRRYFSDAAAIASVLITELANNREIHFNKMPLDSVKNMLIKFKLDKKLKNQGEWPFGVNSGELRVNSGELRVESGEWRVESGEWRVESGKWKVESGELRIRN